MRSPSAARTLRILAGKNIIRPSVPPSSARRSGSRDLIRRFALPVRLAVPENCCGLTLFLAVFDRCGKRALASSATGSAKALFPVRGEGLRGRRWCGFAGAFHRGKAAAPGDRKGRPYDGTDDGAADGGTTPSSQYARRDVENAVPYGGKRTPLKTQNSKLQKDAGLREPVPEARCFLPDLTRRCSCRNSPG